MEKFWKIALKDSKQSSGKRNERCKIGKRFPQNENEKSILTKRSSEGLKEFSLKKVLKKVEKSTKWR